MVIFEDLNATFATKRTASSKSPNARQNSSVPCIFLQQLNIKMTRNDSQRLDMLMYLGLQTHPSSRLFFFL